jgi:hypothetical protein
MPVIVAGLERLDRNPNPPDSDPDRPAFPARDSRCSPMTWPSNDARAFQLCRWVLMKTVHRGGAALVMTRWWKYADCGAVTEE